MKETENKKLKQKHGVPTIISFFIPGLGQLIKGQILKAILIWIGMVVFGILSLVLIGIPLLIILYLWQLYDAYNS